LPSKWYCEGPATGATCKKIYFCKPLISSSCNINAGA